MSAQVEPELVDQLIKLYCDWRSCRVEFCLPSAWEPSDSSALILVS